MLSEVKLDWFRREIARLAGSEREAMDAAIEILMTDWQKVMLNDKVKCCECKLPILYKDASFLPGWPSGSKRPYCDDCSLKPLERKCRICNISIITNAIEDRNFCQACHRASNATLCRLGNCILCSHLCPEEISICYPCMARRKINKEWLRSEYVKVQTHKERAVCLGLTGQLSLTQWLATLEYFNWKCAYCLTELYEHLDHFVPLCKKGNTTKSNCVPSCKKCNDLKHQLHPDKVSAIPLEALNRVRVYLSQF